MSATSRACRRGYHEDTIYEEIAVVEFRLVTTNDAVGIAEDGRAWIWKLPCRRQSIQSRLADLYRLQMTRVIIRNYK